MWTLFERLSFRSAVINWPAVTSGSSTVIPDRIIRAPRQQSVEREVAQRFEAAGIARERIIAGLVADRLAMAALRSQASQRVDELDAMALDGFSEAQRAMHIYRNELPARASAHGAALRAYVEQLDHALGGIAHDFPDHLLIVVSPCAPSAPELRSTVFRVVRDAFTSQEGADDGFVLMTGDVATHRDNPATAYVVDVVPTVLFAAGLPVGRDMDGRVLIDAFDDAFLRRNPLSVIPTYEAKQIEVRRSGGV